MPYWSKAGLVNRCLARHTGLCNSDGGPSFIILFLDSSQAPSGGVILCLLHPGVAVVGRINLSGPAAVKLLALDREGREPHRYRLSQASCWHKMGPVTSAAG